MILSSNLRDVPGILRAAQDQFGGELPVSIVKAAMTAALGEPQEEAPERRDDIRLSGGPGAVQPGQKIDLGNLLGPDPGEENVGFGSVKLNRAYPNKKQSIINTYFLFLVW